MTEHDLSTAAQSGAVVFGFDISVPPNVHNRIEAAGVSVHLYKLIYKFQEDLEALVKDQKQIEMQAGDGTANTQLLGEGVVKQIFEITGTTKKGGAKKMVQALGCQVDEGAFDKSNFFRVRRGDVHIANKLVVQSLKKFKTDVEVVEEGLECGLAFKNLKMKLAEGDVIEAYVEKEAEKLLFDSSPGLKKTF